MDRIKKFFKINQVHELRDTMSSKTSETNDDDIIITHKITGKFCSFCKNPNVETYRIRIMDYSKIPQEYFECFIQPTTLTSLVLAYDKSEQNEYYNKLCDELPREIIKSREQLKCCRKCYGVAGRESHIWNAWVKPDELFMQNHIYFD